MYIAIAEMRFLTIHQVGLSEDDKMYVACGENRIKYNGIKLLSMEQLKEYTNVLFYSQLCIIMLYNLQSWIAYRRETVFC